jgi:hypothetical protein
MNDDLFDLSIESIVEEAGEKPTLFTRPEILNHPNLPKPMHGVNPRTVMGQKKWDEVRREAYGKNNYHCWACGAHRHYDLVGNKFDDDNGSLDCHEMYLINYELKTSEIVEFVALCKNCHSYVHSGRMNGEYDKGRLDEEACWIITTAGDSILIDGGFPPYNVVDGKTYEDEWMDWRLVIGYEQYEPVLKSYSEWRVKYGV